MLMFTATTTFLLELALIAYGLTSLGKSKDTGNKFQKLAGYILVIGGGISMLCTIYFSIKYMGQGASDQASFLTAINV